MLTGQYIAVAIGVVCYLIGYKIRSIGYKQDIQTAYRKGVEDMAKSLEEGLAAIRSGKTKSFTKTFSIKNSGKDTENDN